MLPVVPSLFVYDPVYVPSELMVSLTLSNRGVGPEDKRLPSHVPAKSANENDTACFDMITRLVEPLDHVSVHERKVSLESIWHGALTD
jgi:hypothetical protein